MHRPHKYRRKAWRRTKPTAPGFRLPWSHSLRSSDDSSTRFTRKETIEIAAWGIVALVGMALILHFGTGWKTRQSREEYLERLHVNYSLNETQLAAIRRIESEYHGPGSIFLRPSHAYKEETAHRIAISKQMPPDTAARFLSEQQNNAPSIGWGRH